MLWWSFTFDFGTEDQVAQRLYPSGKNRSIVVDPHHQFGQPVIKGTNILASVLHSLCIKVVKK